MHVKIQLADPATKRIQVKAVELFPDLKELPKDPE
jgi:hypothetical protein